MPADLEAAMRDARALIDEERTRSLWSWREDWVPATPEAACRALEAIERHGDLEAYRRAAGLRRWFSRHSNSPSAA